MTNDAAQLRYVPDSELFSQLDPNGFVRLLTSWNIYDNSVKSPELSNIALKLKSDADRIVEHISLLPNLFTSGFVSTESYYLAKINVELNNRFDDDIARKEQIVDSMVKELMGRQIGNGGSLRAAVLGISMIDILRKHFDRPCFRVGFQSFYANLFVQSWTLFESFASDLWEVALNSRPKLGFTALDAEIAQGEDESAANRKRRKQFSVPVWLLEKSDFNLKNRMGTLLLGKWDFARKHEALDAYRKAFGKTEQDKLDAIFERQELLWLNAIRNVIVHRGVIADAEFLKLVARHPILGALDEGSVIQFDPVLCSQFIRIGYEQSNLLLKVVDNCLLHTG